MTALALTRHVAPWRPQPGESMVEHLAFVHWAMHEGELRADLANKFNWAVRRQAWETYEALDSIPPEEMATEAALARVRVTLTEIMKLQRAVLESPDCVLEPREVMAGVEWLTTEARIWSERKSDVLDWSSLTPDEREIMLQAKEIQDRLISKKGLR